MMEYIGLANMARFNTRSQVYQEMIYASLPPEPEGMEDPLPQAGEDDR